MRAAGHVSRIAGLALVGVGGAALHGARPVAAALGALGVPAGGAAVAGIPMWVRGAAGAIAVVAGLALFYGPDRLLDARRGRMRAPDPLGDPPRDVATAIPYLASLVGVSFMVRWAVGGVVFWLAVLAIALLRARAERVSVSSRRGLELLLVHVIVLGLGVSGVWSFVGHVPMSRAVAASIGWAPSPFQWELGFAQLGLGVAALAGLWIRDHLWLAVGLAWSVFLYGAAAVHLHEHVAAANAAPGNWSFAMLFGDVAIPTLVLTLTTAYQRSGAWPPQP